MKHKFLFALCTLSCFIVRAQYKNDNVHFSTVDPSDLCATLDRNKGYLLLDVRSPGEHDDTSSFTALNIGHLKGAKNINVRELGIAEQDFLNNIFCHDYRI